MARKRNKPFYCSRCRWKSLPDPLPPAEPKPDAPALVPYLALSYWNDRAEGEDQPPDACYLVFMSQ